MPRVLFLAAGSSKRFGSDKRIEVFSKGKTLLGASLTAFTQCNFDITVCLSADACDDYLESELHRLAVAVLRCQDSSRGMGGTLAEAVSKNLDAEILIVALADMPLIRPATIVSVGATARTDRIVLPTYAGRRGHPVAFGRAFFPDLCSLTGDRGAAAIVRHNEQAVIEVATDDAGIHRDADTPDALQRLRSRRSEP